LVIFPLLVISIVIPLITSLHASGRNELIAYANGPYHGIIGVPIQLNGDATGGAPPYTYYWDFGDGNYSMHQNPTHNYNIHGNYTVTLFATDSTDGPNSTVNDSTWALINEFNNPPEKPSIDGKLNGKIGVGYTYRIVTTDPDKDDVSYYIDWGDGFSSGWTRFRESGSDFYVLHSWSKRGSYYIRVKAKDVFDAESDFAVLTVTMPKDLICSFNMIDVSNNNCKINDLSNAIIKGRVKNRFGFPCNYANVEVRIGPDIENSKHVTIEPVDNKGRYQYELYADREGTDYLVRATVVTATIEGDYSNWESITVFPEQTYDLPDLILPHTPKNKTIDSFLISFVENNSNLSIFLRKILG
jgi:hypothetical protein